MDALSRDLGNGVKRSMFVIKAPISQRVLDVIAMNICKYLDEAGVVKVIANGSSICRAMYSVERGLFRKQRAATSLEIGAIKADDGVTIYGRSQLFYFEMKLHTVENDGKTVIEIPAICSGDEKLCSRILRDVLHILDKKVADAVYGLDGGKAGEELTTRETIRGVDAIDIDPYQMLYLDALRRVLTSDRLAFATIIPSKWRWSEVVERLRGLANNKDGITIAMIKSLNNNTSREFNIAILMLRGEVVVRSITERRGNVSEALYNEGNVDSLIKKLATYSDESIGLEVYTLNINDFVKMLS
jgi:hypothetical protein